MARPSIRSRASAAASTSTRTPLSTATSAITTAERPGTKKAKRTAKHEGLMTRVRSAGITKSSASSTKRRRPSKKLPAAENMAGDMLSALPDLGDGDDDDEWEGFTDDEVKGTGVAKRRRRRKVGGQGEGGIAAQQKIVMRSMPHRPGAMKRREKTKRGEVERFGRNLALLSAERSGGGEGKDGGSGDAAREGEGGGQGQKWAVLRRFIEGTLERDGTFGGS
ncbi:hypothetical protein LTR09_008164 [Extremus antarcticus]|uniref:Ribosome biogenesis protein SLX9 n=1 Tax=Extremus antarcticus TaxID=702011 RepID=A0AAJ0DIF2_9PEZI|nr:hypothetical protein LTR09_008164 [Extremus antarcticus]